MKTIIRTSLLLATVFVIFTSCENLDAKFTFSTSDITFTYGPDTITGNLVLTQDTIQSELDSLIQKNGTTIDKLNSVKLKSCVITITSPDTGNFNSFNSFEIYISTPTLAQIQLAALNPVPRDTNSVSLAVNGNEIASYIKSPTFYFMLKGNKTKPITYPISVSIHAEYEVSAGM